MRLAAKLSLSVILALAAIPAPAQQKTTGTGSSPAPPAREDQSLPSAPEPQNVPPPAPPPMKTTPSAPQAQPPSAAAPPTPAAGDTNPRDEVYTLSRTVNFVVVPVTVKDDSGRMVDGLLKKDFSVYENGLEQQIRVFTSDPFPLSAAIVLDISMPENTVRKINDTMSALVGAFSQFDELAFYTYGDHVNKRLDYSAVTDQLAIKLKRTKPRGTPAGVPVTGGPMASGPSINGEPANPSTPHVQTPPRESHVLNDAILTAALDLSKRDRNRRKMIFVISDGREYDSHASYSDVLKVLLSDNIMLYAVAVSQAALPGYRQLPGIHIPGQGYTNILPKYAAATGGEVFTEFTAQNIETAYQRLAEEARNQYTLGYMARQTPSNTYRTIEVRVHRPNLTVRAKDGYYPLPVSSPPP